MTFDEAVSTLDSSGVLAADFPRRTRHTAIAWVALEPAARADELARVHAATSRLGAPWAVMQALAAIGASGDPSWVPRLVGLWREGAISRVACAAGAALRALATPEAYAALVELVDDADPYRADLAVNAVFAQDPRGAYDRLAPSLEPEARARPGGAHVPYAILRAFAPATTTYRDGQEVPTYAEADAPAWLVADPRWIPRLVRLRRDAELGEMVRVALRFAPREPVEAALDAAVRSEGPHAPALATHAIGDRVARYQAGEHEAVWAELRAAGAIGGALYEEALAVARVTMQRVAAGVQLLAERLHARGWQALTGVLHLPPDPEEAASAMRTIEEATAAPLPAALRAYWEIVGHVDFVWNYDLDEAAPQLGLPADIAVVELDPLHVENAIIALADLDEWRANAEGVHAELVEPLRVGLAPDALHKQNVSGGVPYGVTLPSYAADPTLAGDEASWLFVEYLRLCLRWGGFPELARYGEREEVKAWVAEMTAGLPVF
jgi:hypothetical protein